jgi:hypothetical protein
VGAENMGLFLGRINGRRLVSSCTDCHPLTIGLSVI